MITMKPKQGSLHAISALAPNLYFIDTLYFLFILYLFAYIYIAKTYTTHIQLSSSHECIIKKHIIMAFYNLWKPELETAQDQIAE